MTRIQAASIVTKEIKTDWTGIRGTKWIPKFIRVFLESSCMKGKRRKDVVVWSYGGSKLSESLEEGDGLGFGRIAKLIISDMEFVCG
jgi:hypothetical protein